MPIITSRYRNMVHGTNPKEVQQDAEGMQVMLVLGNNMAFWLNCKNVAMKMGLSMPEEPNLPIQILSTKIDTPSGSRGICVLYKKPKCRCI